jgi:hypothetical protein
VGAAEHDRYVGQAGLEVGDELLDRRLGEREQVADADQFAIARDGGDRLRQVEAAEQRRAAERRHPARRFAQRIHDRWLDSVGPEVPREVRDAEGGVILAAPLKRLNTWGGLMRGTRMFSPP